jgi:hypothetical protein
MTQSVPTEVEENAPSISLHPEEEYPPADPAAWLSQAELYWYDGEQRERVFPDSARALFEQGPLGGGFRFNGRGLGERTRPHDSQRPPHDRLSGFVLTTDEKPEEASPEEPIPVFYEYVEGTYVTYWVYFPWSTVPLEIKGLRDLVGLEAAAAESPEAVDNAALALTEMYPDLVEAAAPTALEALSLRDVFHSVVRWVGDRWPVIHEGDWEGISVALGSGEARRAAYFQHGKGPEIRTLEPGESPRVFIARGSHASYPDVDPFSKGSRLFKSYEVLGDAEPARIELLDVRSQPWYGFGGAWGTPGRTSTETGPLGPGEMKGPRPFAQAAVEAVALTESPA